MLILFSIIFLSCGDKDEDTSTEATSDTASEDKEIE